ncbi:MAG: DMT family transporter [Candidatus Kariarchaeaceae archaeon]|jgi:drug/metabolite transporter (DMT)-like permease
MEQVSLLESEEKFVPKRSRGVFFAMGCLFLLSWMPIISNSRPAELSALHFALYLTIWEVICAIPLTSIERSRDQSGIFSPSLDRDSKKRVISIVLATGVIFAVTTFLYVLSFESAGTVNAAIALQAYPLFSISLEFIMIRKRKSWKEIFFTVLLVTGIYYLGTGGTWRMEEISIYFLLALLVPFLWSVAHIILKQTMAKYPITPNQVTLIRVISSTVVFLVVIILLEGPAGIWEGLINPQFQLYALLMGAFYYLELVLWFYSLRHVDVSVASSVTTPAPVFTAFLAILILREILLPYQAVAMIITLVSLYGLLYSGRGSISE